MPGCLTAILLCRTKNIVQAAVQKRNSEALSAMTFAATLGDVDSMEHLLQRGLLINTADYDGRTTLHLAALEGNVKVLELLLQEGADPNVRDRYELPLFPVLPLIIPLAQPHLCCGLCPLRECSTTPPPPFPAPRVWQCPVPQLGRHLRLCPQRGQYPHCFMPQLVGVSLLCYRCQQSPAFAQNTCTASPVQPSCQPC